MAAPQKRTPGGSRASADQKTKNINSIPDAPQTAQAEFWATRIRDAHAKSVEAIIATGKRLIEAKAALAHGEWGRLTGETTREPLLPFSSQTAQKLVQIAQHEVLSNPAHWAGLPASWRTLAEMAKMPADVVQKHIDEGVIHPDITRATAEDLLAELRVQGASQAPPEPPPKATASSPPGDRDRAAREAQAAWARAEAARRAAHRDRQREQQGAWHSAFNISTWKLSRGDFKLLAGCLHPDQQPADRQERYTKAFQIFKKLETHIVAQEAA